MTLEVFLWVVGASLPSLLGFGVALWIRLTSIKAEVDRLLLMHEHPEDTGFGTVGLEQVIKDNTRAINTLSHYIKWLSAQTGPSSPPPPLPDND